MRYLILILALWAFGCGGGEFSSGEIDPRLDTTVSSTDSGGAGNDSASSAAVDVSTSGSAGQAGAAASTDGSVGECLPPTSEGLEGLAAFGQVLGPDDYEARESRLCESAYTGTLRCGQQPCMDHALEFSVEELGDWLYRITYPKTSWRVPMLHDCSSEAYACDHVAQVSWEASYLVQLEETAGGGYRVAAFYDQGGSASSGRAGSMLSKGSMIDGVHFSDINPAECNGGSSGISYLLEDTWDAFEARIRSLSWDCAGVAK